jgi:hypothetical protein
MKKLFLAISIVMFQAGFAQTINDNAGVAGASFLEIGVGARAQGMGGAYCGLVDDVDSIYWNPAGLGRIKKREVAFTHNEWLSETNYEYLAGVLPFDNQGIGASLSLVDNGKIKRTTISHPTGDGSEFDNSNCALTLSYGRMVNEGLSCGLNLKYISSKIDKFSATGFGVDVGGLYKTPIENLFIGAVLQNIGTKMKFVKEKDDLPFNIKLGAGYRIDKLNLAMDINKPKDNDLNINLGGEYWIMENMAVRLGYTSGIDEGLGITGGLGVGFRSLRVDYAYTPYNDLGDIHRISLAIGFKRERIEKVKKEKRVEEKIEKKKPEELTPPVKPKPEKPIVPVKPTPEKPSYLAKLLLYSSPQGASVYLDGIFKGTTACIIYDLIPERPYKLRLTMDGYRDWEKEISLTEESLFLKPELIPTP